MQRMQKKPTHEINVPTAPSPATGSEVTSTTHSQEIKALQDRQAQLEQKLKAQAEEHQRQMEARLLAQQEQHKKELQTMQQQQTQLMQQAVETSLAPMREMIAQMMQHSLAPPPPAPDPAPAPPPSNPPQQMLGRPTPDLGRQFGQPQYPSPRYPQPYQYGHQSHYGNTYGGGVFGGGTTPADYRGINDQHMQLAEHSTPGTPAPAPPPTGGNYAGLPHHHQHPNGAGGGAP